MSESHKLPRGVRRLFSLPSSQERALAELDEEMRIHIAMRVSELEAQGFSRPAAEAEARRRFGDADSLRRELAVRTRRQARAAGVVEWIQTVHHDVRFAGRRLLGSPLFAFGATLTLAIAIGATASVFSLVDGVLFKAFPYRDVDRVFTIWQSNPERHQLQVGMANATYFDFLSQNTTFTTLAVGDVELQYMVTRSRDAERVTGMPVTASLFSVLGVTPALGRPLSADTAAPPEVMLSYEYWQRRFGGERTVLGRTMTLDNPTDPSLTPQHTYTIVGVLPPGLPGRADLWTRMIFDPDGAHNRLGHGMHVFGRLKPGVTPEQGLADLETIAARLATTYPRSNAGWSVRISPFIDQIIGPVRPALAMLLGAAACVLLIGAANLANLFLVRCLSREREIALRMALGATRGRLIAELVTEAGILSLVAGALGVGLSVLDVRILRVLAPPTLPRLADIGVDGRVVAFCAVACFATVMLFGVMPAWQASRASLGAALKEGGRGTGSVGERRLQNALVVLQVAIALVLLTGASLLVESFGRFRRMDPGFRPTGVLTAQIALPTERYRDPVHQAAFIVSVPEHLAVQPGVQSASVSTWLPGREHNLIAFTIVGDAPPDAAHAPASQFVVISPDYFRTMAIPLLRGRSLLSTDDQHSARVAIIDDRLAKRYFAGRDPLGHRLALLYGDTVRIVGVVASVKQSGLAAEDHPDLYLPYPQDVDQVNGFFSAYVSVRMSGDPRVEERSLKQTVASLDPLVPVSDVQTMSARMMDSVGTTRFETVLASLFAIVALLLGAVGIYSVLSYIVTQRRRELAVRIALGARGVDLVGQVVRHAAALTAVGIALGSLAAWVVTRVLSSVFLGVQPHDPGVFLGAAACFGAIAAAAASIPAFRTTRVNPIVALTST